MPRKKSRKNNASATASKDNQTKSKPPDPPTTSQNVVEEASVIVLSDSDVECLSGPTGGLQATEKKDSQPQMSTNPPNKNPWELMNINSTFTGPDMGRFGDDTKLVHILYSQLRIINIFQLLKAPKLGTAFFVNQFWQLYHEDFFRFEVLKNFISNANPETVVNQFIAIHCSHFLVNLDAKNIGVKGDLNEVSDSLFQNFCDLFDKILHQVKPVIKHLDPTPSEISLLGNHNNLDVDGRRHALMNLDIPNHGGRRQQQVASLKEVGQRVNLIRKSISRRGDAVNYSNVTLELLKYYNVRSVNDLYLKNPNGRPITLERDIQEINNIIRLQAKVCFFNVK